MDSIASLLDRLEAIILRSEPIPRAGRESATAATLRAIDEREALGLLRMARSQLPADLRRAQQLRTEADSLQIRAADEARRLVEAAHEESRRIRDGADEYAAQVLNDLETRVLRVLESIRRGKGVLEARVPQATGGL